MPEPLDVALASVRSVTDAWEKEAKRLKQLHVAGDVANTLEYCAGELRAQLREIEKGMRYLTTEQYADAERVDVQTVRRWIRTGRLDAVKGPGGYTIRRDAKPRARKVA